MIPDDAVRVVTGSPLSGRTAIGEGAPADLHGYLGRFHDTVSVLEDDHDRRFLGWLQPGFGAFSRARAFASSLLPRKSFAMTTTTYGSPRAIVPVGLYESVFPWDLQPDLPAQVAGCRRHRARRGTRVPSNCSRRIWLSAPSFAPARRSTAPTCATRSN